MAMASQNQDFYPDPNMGMSGMFGQRYNPMSARSAMDRYFRAYWQQKQRAAAAREALNIKARIASDERAFKGAENAKDRAFRISEQKMDQANKSQLADLSRGWAESDANKKSKYGWLGALANAGTIAVGWDNRYNNSKVMKGIYDSLTNFTTGVNKKKAAYGMPTSDYFNVNPTYAIPMD